MHIYLSSAVTSILYLWMDNIQPWLLYRCSTIKWFGLEKKYSRTEQLDKTPTEYFHGRPRNQSSSSQEHVLSLLLENWTESLTEYWTQSEF